EWYARRLNPPELDEHSVRYIGSEEFRKVESEAKERALTAEQFLTLHNGSSDGAGAGASGRDQSTSSSSLTPNTTTTTTSSSSSSSSSPSSSQYESFLTRGGKFLGLPVTRAFGFLDWKIEREPRTSVSLWVEKNLRSRIEKTLNSGLEGTIASQEESGICNLDDPPYIVTEPKITRF
ncbi:hypothetical protein BGZ94_006716, partial [Podila epigama]